jgi:fumarylpyruvate hydrolase
MTNDRTNQAGGTTPLFLQDPTILPVAGGTQRFAVRRIYCVGRNYLDHIREMGEADERDPPFFFQKPTDAIVQDGAMIEYPSCTEDYQFEIELVVAIGRAGRGIAQADAHAHIFGYAVGLDMTRRDRQRESRERMLPWEPGKSFDASAPCSAIHPVSRIGHPTRGEISLTVNGQARQRGDLDQLIWNVPEIIEQLSLQYDLMPGDLIYTGTPAGVGPVVPGDVLAGAVEGVGTLTVTISERRK